MVKLKGKFKALFNYGGCLGCCTKPPLIISANQPARQQKIHGQASQMPNTSNDFWSSSASEMANSLAQSQRSTSSVSTFNQTHETHGAAGEPSNPNEFVNRALLLWNQTRQQWTANRQTRNHTQVRESKISLKEKYDCLHGTKKPSAPRIPLSGMVELLVDIWKQEGLYD